MIIKIAVKDHIAATAACQLKPVPKHLLTISHLNTKICKSSGLKKYQNSPLKKQQLLTLYFGN